MSTQALEAVRKVRAGGFSQAVLLFLAASHNNEKNQCNPSREAIAEFFSSPDDPCTIKRVTRALAHLREIGAIRSEVRPGKKGASNWYFFPALEQGKPHVGVDPIVNPNPTTYPSPTIGPGPIVGTNPTVGLSPTVEGGSDPRWGRGVDPMVGPLKKNRKKEEKKEKEYARENAIDTPSSLSDPTRPPIDHPNDGENAQTVLASRGGSAPVRPEEGSAVSSREDALFDDLLSAQKPAKAPRRQKRAQSGEYAKSSYVGVEDVPDDLWNDWCLLRKRKHALVTQRVIDGIAKEAAKAGITLSDALDLCVVNGWSSIKADWSSVRNRANRSGSYHRHNEKPPELKDFHHTMKQAQDMAAMLGGKPEDYL